MKRRQLLVGSGAVTAALLAGCTGSAQTGGDPGRTITVSNSATVRTDPDLAIVRASVEATGDDAQTVRNQLSERSDRLYQELVDSGIPEDQITTDRFEIGERTDRQRDTEGVDPGSEAAEELRFYEGTHRFRIEVTDVESVGTVVDTAVAAGADSIGRIEYTLSEQKRVDHRQQALESALAAARNEAEFIAAEVDTSVTDVRNVDTSNSRVSPVYREVAAEDTDAGSRSTELRPGDVTVRATVTVTYTIR